MKLTDAEMRAQLKQWTPLVTRTAWRFRRRLAALHDFEDLQAIGLMALWKAIETYDTENPSGASLSTYAKKCITHRFLHEVKQSLFSTRQVAYHRFSLSTEYPDGSPVVEPHSPGLDPEAEAIGNHAATTLRNAVGRLSAEQRQVITSRFLSRHEKSFVELGKARGVSRQRMEQIQVAAMKRLRAMLEHENVTVA